MEGAIRYHPGADQVALVASVEDSLASLLPLSRVHTSPEECAQTWSELVDLGLFTIGLSEDRGGSGLGAVEEALIAIGLGRGLAAPSVFATMGAVHALSQVSTDMVQTPRTAAAYRHGSRIVMIQDSQAELCLVRDESEAALYQIDNRQTKMVEDRLWLDRLCEAPTLGQPLSTMDAPALLRLKLIDAAALAGIADAATIMAVAYAGMREQFGRPIGSFQAVKHHCADMAIAARCARDQTSFAAVAIDDDRPDAAFQVECAFLVAGTAAVDNSGKNIQVHGGIGFSDEADPHLLLKRARILIAIGGGLEAAATRVGNAQTSW